MAWNSYSGLWVQKYLVVECNNYKLPVNIQESKNLKEEYSFEFDINTDIPIGSKETTLKKVKLPTAKFFNIVKDIYGFSIAIKDENKNIVAKFPIKWDKALVISVYNKGYLNFDVKGGQIVKEIKQNENNILYRNHL